jgi:hypothetical protein
VDGVFDDDKDDGILDVDDGVLDVDIYDDDIDDDMDDDMDDVDVVDVLFPPSIFIFCCITFECNFCNLSLMFSISDIGIDDDPLLSLSEEDVNNVKLSIYILYI